jgi:hypothetical protein
MTDEVKAALQNWRADPYADNSRSCRYAEILAKAYAALHPADDDEPVTVEWLKETIADFGKVATLYHGDRVCRLSPINFTLKRTTRGQLRRLLSALEE